MYIVLVVPLLAVLGVAINTIKKRAEMKPHATYNYRVIGLRLIGQMLAIVDGVFLLVAVAASYMLGESVTTWKLSTILFIGLCLLLAMSLVLLGIVWSRESDDVMLMYKKKKQSTFVD